MSSLQRGNATPQVPTSVDFYAVNAATVINVTAQTVIKASPGRLVRIDVTVAGSGAGSVNDTATIAGIAAANLVTTIPAVAVPLWLDWPMQAGIVVTPGTGQTLAVGYF